MLVVKKHSNANSNLKRQLTLHTDPVGIPFISSDAGTDCPMVLGFALCICSTGKAQAWVNTSLLDAG